MWFWVWIYILLRGQIGTALLFFFFDWWFLIKTENIGGIVTNEREFEIIFGRWSFIKEIALYTVGSMVYNKICETYT